MGRATLMLALRVTSTGATMSRGHASARRATCTTGTFAAGRLAGRGGRGFSSRWAFSTASMRAAAPLVRFHVLEASWAARRRRRRRSRKPEMATRALPGPRMSMLCIPPSTETPGFRGAKQGDYKTARVHLISTCRLIQRAMRTLAHQESYLSFIVQAEKLDGFMRERECQEQIFGADGSS